jgi:hypothetical protein
VNAAPFTVQIPSLNDLAIERIAEVLVSMLDTIEHQAPFPAGVSVRHEAQVVEHQAEQVGAAERRLADICKPRKRGRRPQ